ncbi:hypothetical protein LAZ67_5003065 [Cordylochernes scorpioides]|uniref:HTH CENPB-type domain-containing protein n=1 Tax=Cordylochernes scorpioides TaxID=51811 RepID=A0ABY6KIR9_9ARAC|nr:hypothetical protein LAZ67_5003065 [Cordylochernes scorpioides]
MVSPALLELVLDLSIESLPYSNHLSLLLKLNGSDITKAKSLPLEYIPVKKFTWSINKASTNELGLEDLNALQLLEDASIDICADTLTCRIQTPMGLLSPPQKIVGEIPTLLIPIDPELDADISLMKIAKEIVSLKNNKAAGYDSIQNEAIKALPENTSRPFSCLCLGHTQSSHPLLTSTQQLYCRIMSSQKRKRESITIEKKEICQLARNNPTMSKNEIGKRFSLPPITVRDILTQAEKWENYTVGSSKRQRVGKFRDLEDALFNWFTQKRANNIIITDDLLREKAKKLGEHLDVPENFAYSSGWLQRFKGRFHISHRRLCGEGASISPAIIDEHLTNLNSILANSGYDPANIYNADETGLFFS